MSRVQRPAFQICAGCNQVAVPERCELWVPPDRSAAVAYYLCAVCTDVKPREADEIRERAAARMLAMWRAVITIQNENHTSTGEMT
jgi:hypothetical protein